MKGNWIPIEDRLPPHGEWCYVAWKNSENVGIATYDARHNFFYSEHWSEGLGLMFFTHWQPVNSPVHPNLEEK